MTTASSTLINRRPVIITRPLEQGQALYRKVQALGREAVLLPLLEIHPLDDYQLLDHVLANLGHYALVAFVSPNAINAAFARRSCWPTTLPLAIMGEGSRQALAAHGVDAGTHQIVSPLDPMRTDSQTLLAALDLSQLVGRVVLIVRGESGRELLAEELRAAGVEVEQIAAYRRAAPSFNIALQTTLSVLLAKHCEWIITSSEALQILLGWVQQMAHYKGVADAVVRLQRQTLIVPHVRIAETAHDLGFDDVICTGSGDETVLAALQSRHE
jgi:uroporphyrinogen-III synthase